jgi:hypothetical protein
MHQWGGGPHRGGSKRSGMCGSGGGSPTRATSLLFLHVVDLPHMPARFDFFMTVVELPHLTALFVLALVVFP